MADHKIQICLDLDGTQKAFPKSKADIVSTNQGHSVQYVLDTILQFLPEADIDKIDIIALANSVSDIIKELNEARGTGSLISEFDAIKKVLNTNTSDIDDIEISIEDLYVLHNILENSINDKFDKVGGTISGDVVISGDITSDNIFADNVSIKGELLIDNKELIKPTDDSVFIGDTNLEAVINSSDNIKANIAGTDYLVYTEHNRPTALELGAVDINEHDTAKRENQIFHDWVSTDLTDDSLSTTKIILKPANYESASITEYNEYFEDSSKLKVLAPLRSTEDGLIYDEILPTGEIIRRAYEDELGIHALKPEDYIYDKIDNKGPSTFMSQTSFFINDDIIPDDIDVAYVNTTAGQIAYIKNELKNVEDINKEFDNKYDKTGGLISGDVRIEGSVEIWNKNVSSLSADKMIISDDTVDTVIKSKDEIKVRIAGTEYELLHTGSTIPGAGVDVDAINKSISDLEVKVDTEDKKLKDITDHHEKEINDLRDDLVNLINDGLGGVSVNLSELTSARVATDGTVYDLLVDRLEADSDKADAILTFAQGLKTIIDDMYSVETIDSMFALFETKITDLKENIRLIESTVASTKDAMDVIESSAVEYNKHLTDAVKHITDDERTLWNNTSSEVDSAKGQFATLTARLDNMSNRKYIFNYRIKSTDWELKDGLYEYTLTHNLNSESILFNASSTTSNRFVFLSGQVIDENSIKIETDVIDDISISISSN